MSNKKSATADTAKTKSIRDLSGLELFVGAGGLALGTARAGFKHRAVFDSNAQACETLRRNQRNNVPHVSDWEIVETNVSDVDFSTYSGIDLLSGGPPCQPFSQGGKRDGRADSRDMFPQFIRAVRECQAKSFIVENVKGLLHGEFFNYFNYLIYQLRFPLVIRRKSERWTEHKQRLERLYTSGKYTDVQYKVITQVLNAADYGVAQKRHRVFIVGIRSDLKIEYSFPLATHSREMLLVDQWIDETYWCRHRIPIRHAPKLSETTQVRLAVLSKEPVGSAWRTVRDSIGDLPQVAIGQTSHTVLNHFLNPGARAYAGHDGCALDAPAKTIKAGHHGVPGGENMLRLDDGNVRYFSVRECARLQAFPDEWAFDGSWCNSMGQIGNAVPVSLAEVIAKPLATALLKTS